MRAEWIKKCVGILCRLEAWATKPHNEGVGGLDWAAGFCYTPGSGTWCNAVVAELVDAQR